MIISKVTKEQIAKWKEIYEQKKAFLKPNRISGDDLNDYFVKKYTPKICNYEEFKNVVILNAKEDNPKAQTKLSDIKTYETRGVLVGIDLKSGFFHVECEEIDKAIPIWDDLFVTRELSKEDLENFVLTAQYILLAKI